VNAGSSILDASVKVREKLTAAAGALLEAAASDIEIEDGHAFVRGAPASAVSLERVVRSALPTFARPGPVTADFEATVYHHQPTVTYTSAVHIAHVEVDPGTGAVRLLRYVVAHDCGKLINPMIVEGQIHGGVAQGVGGGLLEEMVYDEQGQLLTGTFMDYLVPTAMELPPIETVHLEYPSPRNPLGIKGIGEGGAISPPAAIANAVEDALGHLGVRVTKNPLGPDTVRALLVAAHEDKARAGGTGGRP
jgi:carbon-monoxide dehydrogenase large subunit